MFTSVIIDIILIIMLRGGPKYRSSECQRLKAIEDKWICRMGSFYGISGLNTREEEKAIINCIGKNCLKHNLTWSVLFLITTAAKS